MPSISYDHAQIAITNFTPPTIKNFDTFIESGTFVGQTIFQMEPYFKTLHTVELSKDLWQRCKDQYDRITPLNNRKITFHHGESHKVFETLLPTIKDPAVFFLDGHWSCEETACGSKEVPLLEELQSIISRFEPEAIIIIDDYRLFDGHDPVVSGWKDITKDKVLDIVKPRMSSFYYLNSELADKDRMVINLRSK